MYISNWWFLTLVRQITCRLQHNEYKYSDFVLGSIDWFCSFFPLFNVIPLKSAFSILINNLHLNKKILQWSMSAEDVFIWLDSISMTQSYWGGSQFTQLMWTVHLVGPAVFLYDNDGYECSSNLSFWSLMIHGGADLMSGPGGAYLLYFAHGL